MSDCGNDDEAGPDFSGTIVLDDSATDFMPTSSPLTPGTYKPTDHAQDSDSFPGPAPAGPYKIPGLVGTDTLNGTFLDGSDLNGTWNLYIVDDLFVGAGTMENWTIRFDFAALPCLHKDTLVHTVSGKKVIRDIKAGDMVIDHKGKPVKVEYNMLFPATRSFIRIPKGSLGKGNPTNSVYIRKGHPILIDGKEVFPENLSLKNSNIVEKKLKQKSIVYSLCTKERTFVKMNGIDVATWERKDWEDNVHKRGEACAKQ